MLYFCKNTVCKIRLSGTITWQPIQYVMVSRIELVNIMSFCIFHHIKSIKVWENMMEFTKKSKIAIVGTGKLGGSLALALSAASYNVVSVFSRNANSALNVSKEIDGCIPSSDIQETINVAEIVFITTPDDVISKIANSSKWSDSQGVIHCSGASGIELFSSIESCIEFGSFHPMQTFSSIKEGSKSMQGITFAIDGTDKIVGFLKEITNSFNSGFVLIPSEYKPMYHLTGTLMGNLLLEYVAISAKLWEQIGYDQEKGIQSLVPMMRQVADNLENIGLPEALAGPFVRGDIGTIKKHLEILKEDAPQALNLYCELALAGFYFVKEDIEMNLELKEEITEMLKSKLQR